MSDVTAEVMGQVRHGRTDDLVARLASLTVAERRAVAVALKEYVKTPAARQRLITPALLVAGAGCLATGAQVATWLNRREFRRQRGRGALVVRALTDRGVDWAPGIIDRLVDTLPTQEWELELEWRFVAELIVAAGTSAPRGDAFVTGWVMQQGYAPGLTVLERLRSDVFLPELLPRLFEVDAAAAFLTSLTGETGSSITAFPAALATLAAEGRVDRGALLDGCLGRFLRGGTPQQLKGFVQLHTALEPTAAEVETRALDYVRLLPDAPPVVATLALAGLRALDGAGRLELDTLLEGAAAVLRRPDKALVRTQLSWLDSVARRERDRVGDVLTVVAHAFAQEDVALQERALAVVEGHASACTPEVRAHLAAQAAGLSADLPARARACLGDPGPAAPSRAAAPAGSPAPAVGTGRRRETVPTIVSPAELAAELVALGPGGYAALEPVLDATVRLAATDRAGLLDAVAPVMARHEKEIAQYAYLPWVGGTLFDQVLDIVRTVRDRRSGPGPAAKATGAAGDRNDHRLERVVSVRLAEIGLWVTERPVPFLLSTPTWTTGHIDPHTLVDRLATAEAGGWDPWPTDLSQAILRLPRAIDPDATARAARLVSPAGRRLAEVLAAGGTADPVTRRVVVLRRRGRHESEADRARPDDAVYAAVDGPHPAPFVRELFRLDPPVPFGFGTEELWPAVLPSHREVAAAHLLDHFEYDLRGTFGALVLLSDCAGPCGPAMVLSVAYGLTARHSEDRVAAVDALIAMLGAGDLDPGALGAELGALSVGGQVKLSRAVASLAEVARAVAGTSVAAIALGAAPSLLARPRPPHGTPDLLALASRLVQPGSPTNSDTVTQLRAVADRGGSSRLVTEAARLHRILTAS